MARQPDSGFAENFLRRDGRLNRLRYFKRILLLSLVEIVIFIAIFIMNMNALGQLSSMGNITLKFFMAAALIPFFCLMVRRLHDCNRDEKLAYASLALNVLVIITTNYSVLEEPTLFERVITALSAVIGIYALFCPGTKGDNQYGEDPLA